MQNTEFLRKKIISYCKNNWNLFEIIRHAKKYNISLGPKHGIFVTLLVN